MRRVLLLLCFFVHLALGINVILCRKNEIANIVTCKMYYLFHLLLVEDSSYLMNKLFSLVFINCHVVQPIYCLCTFI